MHRRNALGLMGIGLLGGNLARAADPKPTDKFVLVELFTSQG